MLDYNALFLKRKNEILNSATAVTVTGKSYYVSNEGDDNNDGLSAVTPWKTLSKVSDADLNPGDGVFFRRGDLFRGKVQTKSGVTYSAYGEGKKPMLYGSELSLADPTLWEIYDGEKHIWKSTEKLLDVGTLVFDDGKAHSRKLIPSYRGGRFVCRDNEEKDFIIADEMTEDLDVFWYYDEVMTTKPSKGEDFPVPQVLNGGVGDVYLRCDKGNPGEVFKEIEFLPARHMFYVGTNENVTIDNLCIKYVGAHGVSAGGGNTVGLHVTNCEFGWIGGVIQTYLGLDPNYPEGKRGSVTRFGNAIEIYGGCDDYVVKNNYIYEVYDAGITHQITARKKVEMKNVTYADNVIEKCVYGIEYFLEPKDDGFESFMDNIVIKNNFIRLSGYGWGQQRHNYHTPAAIKGWSYPNMASNFVISANIFDRCAYRLLHLVALKDEYCPEMVGNTYIQSRDGKLGQYGGNEAMEPENLNFSETAVKEIFGDKTATVIEC